MHRAYRALEHGRVTSACLQERTIQEFPAEIRDFAKAFIALQKGRHEDGLYNGHGRLPGVERSGTRRFSRTRQAADSSKRISTAGAVSPPMCCLGSGHRWSFLWSRRLARHREIGRSPYIPLDILFLFVRYNALNADTIMGGLELPTIRISDKSMQRLKKWAEPLEDTTESAFAKVLDAAERFRDAHAPEPRSPEDAGTSRRPEPETAPRPKHSIDAFRWPLLDTLHALGGRASAEAVRSAMRDRMAPRLFPGDLDRLKSGQERWWNNVQWQRHRLKEEGYLRADSPRGVWELSDKGTALMETRSEDGPGSIVDHLLAIPDVGEGTDFERARSGPRRVDL